MENTPFVLYPLWLDFFTAFYVFFPQTFFIFAFNKTLEKRFFRKTHTTHPHTHTFCNEKWQED
jgi:hypothetical protein